MCPPAPHSRCPIPPQVPLPSRAVAVAAGARFSLVLDENGMVHSWGNNQYGTLGRAASGDLDHIPGNVTGGLPPMGRVAAGGGHGAGVALSDGALWTWGSNFEGQLGRPVPGDYTAVPGPVSGLGGAVLDVSLGRYHTVVVTMGGDVYCWGSNLRGQCGPGGPTMEQAGSSLPNPVPTLLPRSLWGGLGAVSVATGQFNTLVQTTDGAVWGFGRNFQGNLGTVNYGFTKPVDTPVCVSCALPGGGLLHRVVGFAAGSDHTMLLVKERAREGHPPVLYGMGSNRFGQLGAGKGVTTTPVGCPCRDPRFGGELCAPRVSPWDLRYRLEGGLTP